MSCPSLLDITLSDISQGFRDETFTAQDLVTAYLGRIADVDGEFKSIIEVNKDALQTARALDEERIKSGPRSFLHGVPIVIKDNLVTADATQTTAGSLALVGARPPYESTVTRRLREAGAIMLAKANLTEWAHTRFDNAVTGWSARGGQCMGPFYRRMKTLGSSSGSAVATALGLGYGSIGTETAGSITNPSGKLGVVGLKPTTGLVSRHGVIPVSDHRDTVGPMTRTLRDAAAILSIIAGRDENDKRTWDQPSVVPDFLAACDNPSPKGLRLGVPRHAFNKDHQPAELLAFEQALDELRAAGVTIVDDIVIEGVEEYQSWSDKEQTYMVWTDFKRSIEAYMKTVTDNPQNIHTLEDLITFTRNEPKELYPARNTAQFDSAASIDTSSDRFKYIAERTAYIAANQGIDGTLRRHNLDALLGPMATTVPIAMASISGSPVISMPLAQYPADQSIVYDVFEQSMVSIAPGIPFPICFFGKRYSETTLIRIASLYEKVHKMDKPVMYRKPQIDLEDVLKRN